MTGGLELTPRNLRADPRAVFTRLFTAYFREVWRWLAVLGVRPEGLRDATQAVFSEAWRALDALGEVGSSRPWLFAIAAEVARARRGGTLAAPGSEADGEEVARVTLDRFLAPLTEGEREAFLLFEVGGLSSAQIADLTGAAPAMVAARLRAARACVESAAARLACT